MSKERLFHLLRKERFILWVGAGFSIYAGYPSGKALADYLNERLGESKFEEGASLTTIANRYEKIYGRNAVIEDIKNRFFSEAPKSLRHHEVLATIPYFKTIITTNYDYLFELAYKERLIKITNDKDLSKVDGKKVELIKIHGDFTNTENFVISPKDYASYINKFRNTLLGNFITSAVVSNHILFIGYSFDDINTLALFEDVREKLGNEKREWFLVTPFIKEYERNDLQKSGVTVIQTRGEELIEEFQSILNDNIVNDFNTKKIDYSILTSYLHFRGLLPNIELDAESQRVSKISSVDTTPAKASFKLVVKNGIEAELNKILAGETFGEIEIPSSFIEDFSFKLNSVKVIGLEGMETLGFQTVPAIEEKATLFFGSTEVNDVLIKTFKSTVALGFWFNLYNLTFKAETKDGNYSIFNCNLKIGEVFENLNKGLIVGRFIKHLSQGSPVFFTASFGRISYPFGHIKALEQTGDDLVRHFENLKLIEEFYDIRFSNFIITESDIKAAKRVSALVTGITDTSSYSGIIDFNVVDMEELKNANETNSAVVLNLGQDKPIQLHGKECKIENLVAIVNDAIIVNFIEVYERKTNRITVESLSKKVIIRMMKQSEEII
jgi:hypothetical protein